MEWPCFALSSWTPLPYSSQQDLLKKSAAFVPVYLELSWILSPFRCTHGNYIYSILIHSTLTACTQISPFKQTGSIQICQKQKQTNKQKRGRVWIMTHLPNSSSANQSLCLGLPVFLDVKTPFGESHDHFSCSACSKETVYEKTHS